MEVYMELTSTSYSHNDKIPLKYVKVAAEGSNISPQFSWTNIPSAAKSFVLAIIDHHPIASNWVHWLVVDIPSNITSIPEGASNTSEMPEECVEIVNTFGMKGYGGPQPPRGSGKHNYDATIYALNVKSIGLSGRVTESQFLMRFGNNIVEKATLTGYYER